MDIQVLKKMPQSGFSSQPPSTRHSLFEVILLIVVVALFYFFLLQPKLAALTVAKDQLTVANEQNEKAQLSKNTLQGLIQKMKTHPLEIAQLDEAMPLNGRFSRIQLALEDLINGAGMKVNNISLDYDGNRTVSGNLAALASPFTQVRKLQKVTASVNVNGRLDQFESLLKKLETNGKIYDITGFEISTVKEDTLDFKLILQTYYYE